ncbi:MAG: NAD(P)H-dependent oxidoreductase [Solirubrobacterales bacterium]|nr:NAD(P)H-dependent oxidoreductase [Solirubrobacterales bacterium]HRV60987.1 NAD(P)H-dependent oxidoreductase [Solirubrobacterales bacterium]
MKVLAIVGSLRENSFSEQVARAAGDLAPEGVEVEVYEGLASVPAYNADHDPAYDGPEPVPAEVEDLRNQISAADALLVVTPEYNAGPPGYLKNAIDWASRPHKASSLAGKPAAIVSQSPMPFGGIWANQALRKSFTITGTPTVERELAIGKVDEKIEDGRLTDDQARADVIALMAELNELVAVIANPDEEAVAA